jgi:hypothetical protein
LVDVQAKAGKSRAGQLLKCIRPSDQSPAFPLIEVGNGKLDNLCGSAMQLLLDRFMLP